MFLAALRRRPDAAVDLERFPWTLPLAGDLEPLLADRMAQNCQFIIATHSPILMAFPGACIRHAEDGARHVTWPFTGTVREATRTPHWRSRPLPP